MSSDDEETGATSSEEKLRELALFSEKVVAHRIITNVYKLLKGMYKEDKARLFLMVFSDRTKGNGHRVKYGSGQEVPLDHLQILHCAGEEPLVYVVQKLWRHLRDFQNLPRPGPGQPVLCVPA